MNSPGQSRRAREKWVLPTIVLTPVEGAFFLFVYCVVFDRPLSDAWPGMIGSMIGYLIAMSFIAWRVTR